MITINASNAITCAHLYNDLAPRKPSGQRAESSLHKEMLSHLGVYPLHLALGSVASSSHTLSCPRCLLAPNIALPLDLILAVQATPAREIAILTVNSGMRPLLCFSHSIRILTACF